MTRHHQQEQEEVSQQSITREKFNVTENIHPMSPRYLLNREHDQSAYV